VLAMTAAWGQLQGTREQQQDSACITRWPDGFHLLLVADGIGGHAGGHEASRIVAAEMRAAFLETGSRPDAEFSVQQALETALESANRAVERFANERPELEGMGSTVVAMAFDGSEIDWVSVGDSALYLFRDGALTCLNQRHTTDNPALAHVMGDTPIDPADDVPALLEAVMGKRIELLDRPAAPVPLHDADVVILATDGIEALGASGIEAGIAESRAGGPEAVVRRLLGDVSRLQRASQDNATVVAALVSERPTDVLPFSDR
jgi:serine/threonine protein phosphatase PrpC